MGVLAREALVGFEQGEHNQVKQGPGGTPEQSAAVCAAVSLSTQPQLRVSALLPFLGELHLSALIMPIRAPCLLSKHRTHSSGQ